MSGTARAPLNRNHLRAAQGPGACSAGSAMEWHLGTESPDIPKLTVKMIQPLKAEFWARAKQMSLPPSRPPAACSNSAGPASNHLEVYCLIVMVWVPRPPPLALPAGSLHWLGLIRTRGPGGTCRKQAAEQGPDSQRPTPRELGQQGRGRGVLPAPLRPCWVPEEAARPSLAFPACSWTCTNTQLSAHKGSWSLAMLPESPQHPSAGTGALSPTRQ